MYGRQSIILVFHISNYFILINDILRINLFHVISCWCVLFFQYEMYEEQQFSWYCVLFLYGAVASKYLKAMCGGC